MLLDPDATLEAVASNLQDLPFPWSGDPVEIVGWGFSNVVLRAGADVLIRVPRTPGAKDRSQRTAEVLRRLPLLPLAVPEVLGVLPAGPRLPFGAVLLRKLPGAVVDDDVARADREAFTGDLAAFLSALHNCGDEPVLDILRADGAGRAVDVLDAATAAATADLLAGRERQVFERWATAYRRWFAGAEVVPIHGDVWPGNLLHTSGRLSGALDWDEARVGPRAVDLCGVWYLGRDFAEEAVRAYAARNACDFEVLHEETRLAGVRRELRGVTWSLRHDDPEELKESLDKVRRSLREFLLPPG
ncbi:phosphotransferase family protein [Streptomyces sp. BE303]|uniref:phosphotransferase family protein n=1 Tax=Streptomyces sp. BE303 TaxID=3002528 RepID=UPI002E7667AE|nr:aminoglycoside phosphotransferase family protein [Streptomyces sp. BE303]MED7949739.1 aminoglycoside phosphotransferase family protein [Streptomyces sp. BE303]